MIYYVQFLFIEKKEAICKLLNIYLYVVSFTYQINTKWTK